MIKNKEKNMNPIRYSLAWAYFMGAFQNVFFYSCKASAHVKWGRSNSEVRLDGALAESSSLPVFADSGKQVPNMKGEVRNSKFRSAETRKEIKSAAQSDRMRITRLNVAIITFTLLLGWSWASQAQICEIQHKSITSQTEWDQFVQEIESCTHLLGNISISEDPTDPIVSFHGITHINTITGNLAFRNLSKVENLWGWEHLESISGSLIIKENPGLRDLEGLHSMQTVTNWIDIHLNAQLNSLYGLRSIQGTITALYLSELPALESLHGLDGITQVTSRVSIRNMNNLRSLEGLHHVKNVGTGIHLFQLHSLTDLYGLAGLEKVQGSGLDIIECPIDGIEGLTHLSYCSFLSLGNCHEMSKVEGPPALTTLYQLAMGNCKLVEKIVGFENVDSLKFGIMLSRLPNLTDFSAFPSVKFIQQSITFNDLFALEDIHGFESLDSIRAWVEIRKCPNLKSFSSLKAAKYIQSLVLNELDAFNDSFFLSELNHVVSLRIEECNALRSISGTLDKRLMLRNINLQNNASLLHINGLERVHSALAYIYIENNQSLESILGLKNATLSSDVNINIRSNNSLNQCAIPLLCTAVVENRTVFLSFNRGFCSSSEGIRTICRYALNLQDNIIIKPNPATDLLNIQADFARFAQARIVNANGVLMDSFRLAHKQEIDISSWPPGIYFLYLNDGWNNSIKKFIKM